MRTNERTRALSVALAPIYSLVAFAVAFSFLVPVGAATGPSAAAIAADYAGSYLHGQPSPYLAANVTLTNLSLGVTSPGTTYPVQGATAVTWVTDPYIAPNTRVLNPIAFQADHVVAPGALTGDNLPGPASTCTTVGYPAGSAHCLVWTNTALWQVRHRGYQGATPEGQGTVANSTGPYGQPIVTVSANNTDNGGFARAEQVTEATLALPVTSLPSPILADDYLTAIISLSSNNCPSLVGEPTTDSCTAEIGVGNATSAYIVTPYINTTSTSDVVESTAWSNHQSAYSEGAGGTSVVPALLADPSSRVATAGWQKDAGGVGVNETSIISVPLSDLTGPDVGLNVSTAANPCPSATASGCATQLNITLHVQTGAGSAYQNVTATLWGLALTASPMSVGSESRTAAWYTATGHYARWDNTTEVRTVQGPYGAGLNLTRWDPSWGASGWVAASGASESWVAPAKFLTNVTTTYYTASGGGGIASYSFPLAFPSSFSLLYSGGAAVPYDIAAGIPGVNYTSVVACQTAYQCAPGSSTASNMASVLGAAQAGQNVLIKSGCSGGTCNPSYSEVDPYNAVVNETLAYNSSTWCTLVSSPLCPGPIISPPQNGTTGGPVTSPATPWYDMPVGLLGLLVWEALAIVAVVAVVGYVWSRD